MTPVRNNLLIKMRGVKQSFGVLESASARLVVKPAGAKRADA